MFNERIGIIVPIYKVEKYLCRCLDSIVNQSYSNLEIILVNDGSPDNCHEICENYKRNDKRIKVIHQKNMGLSAARNTGLKELQSSFLVFIDSDDYIELDMIEELYKLMKETKSDIVCCGHKQIFDSGNIEELKGNTQITTYSKKEALSKFLFTNVIDVVSWNKLYKRELFTDIKYPVGKLYEDHFTTYKIIDRAEKITYTSKVLYNYCKRSTSIGGNEYNPKTMQLKEALDEECKFIISEYPDLKDNINLAYCHWMFVIYNKMLLVDSIDNNFEKFLINKIQESVSKLFFNENLSKTRKLQYLIFLGNRRIYKTLYKVFLKKYR